MPPLRALPTRALVLAALALAALPAAAPAADTYTPDPIPGETRPVILVGNNWDGTTDIVDPDTFERLDRINVIPDKAERLAEIQVDPVGYGFFLGVRNLVGEGHDQWNDDVFSSPDGRTIYVSRPSFKDVVAIDLRTERIKWRTQVEGYRSDHMMISEDGRQLYVSASTGNVVHEIDTATGRITGGFESGDSPHENVITRDGRTILHASIGRVYLPVDRPRDPSDATRGGEFFQIVDRATGRIRHRLDMRAEMEEAGYEDFSGAVRPMALSPDEKTLYFQLSFFHGFVEYDLENLRVKRIARLPLSEEAAGIPPEGYLLDSAHHGLAMDSRGEKLCVAGTMSDYGAIVQRDTFTPRILDVGEKPYWSTNSADGRYCYVSASGSDHVAVISYDTEEIITRFKVGYHPQRVRNGVVRIDQYRQGAYGERFRFRVRHARGTLRFGRNARGFMCRAERARALRLVRCRVRLTRGRTLVAVGEAFRRRGRRAFPVRVKLTRAGRELLERSGDRGTVVRLRARGVDSTGRTGSTSRRVRIRGTG